MERSKSNRKFLVTYRLCEDKWTMDDEDKTEVITGNLMDWERDKKKSLIGTKYSDVLVRDIQVQRREEVAR